jgi:hypothetical protein
VSIAISGSPSVRILSVAALTGPILERLACTP